MAISFIGQASAAATSVTLPTTVAGDLIVIFAYNGASITVPTLATGYTNISNNTGNANAFRMSYAFASGVGDVSGTWTSATLVIAAVYRGVGSIGAAASTTTATGTTTNITGITLQSLGGSSWGVAYAGSAQATSMSTPAASTLRSSQTAAASMGILMDSNGGVNTWAFRTSTNGVTAVNAGGSFEMKPAFQAINNYQFVKVGDGMSVSERIR